jgi:hypothetical protein
MNILVEGATFIFKWKNYVLMETEVIVETSGLVIWNMTNKKHKI